MYSKHLHTTSSLTSSALPISCRDDPQCEGVGFKIRNEVNCACLRCNFSHVQSPNGDETTSGGLCLEKLSVSRNSFCQSFLDDLAQLKEAHCYLSRCWAAQPGLWGQVLSPSHKTMQEQLIRTMNHAALSFSYSVTSYHCHQPCYFPVLFSSHSSSPSMSPISMLSTLLSFL